MYDSNVKKIILILDILLKICAVKIGRRIFCLCKNQKKIFESKMLRCQSFNLLMLRERAELDN